MRVLNIIPFLPWPLITGGHNGVFHSIEAVKDSVELFLLFPFNGDRDSLAYLESRWPNVTFIPFVGRRKDTKTRKFAKKAILKLNRFIFPDYNYLLESYFISDAERYESEWFDLITDSISNFGIDTVQVEFPSLLSLVLWLPVTVQKVFVHHELRFVKNEQLLDASNVFGNHYYEFWQRKNKVEEIALLNMYDKVITLSKTDRDKLRNSGVVVPIFTSFLIVDQPNQCYFKESENRLTFLGSGGHIPNSVGLDWFLSNEWAFLLHRKPDIQLTIVGKWEDTDIQMISSKYPNIHFSGYVENLYDVLSGSIMIVPITVGSGIRIKILESASLHIPFVSTSIGTEGLPFEDEVSCLIEDDPHLFSQRLLMLLEDKEKQRRLSDSACSIVYEQFSYQAFLKNRMEILTSGL